MLNVLVPFGVEFEAMKGYFSDIELDKSEDKKLLNEMCEMQLVKTEDDIKALDVTVSGLETSIAEGKEKWQEMLHRFYMPFKDVVNGCKTCMQIVYTGKKLCCVICR